METAILAKRFWAYVINAILYLGFGFAAGLPFLLLLHVHIVAYVFISLGLAIIISFLLNLLLMIITKGYNIGNAIFGIQYVARGEERINGKQAFIRASSESIFIFILFDLIYFIKNRTERGVIDRLSDTFAIDIRR